MNRHFLGMIIFVVISSVVTDAQLAAGGGFTLEQSVIATGGGRSAGGAFIIEGTDAQAIAGTRSVDSTRSLHGGFWNAAPFAPTAARVSITGRVLMTSGQGIRNASVTLTESDGSIKTSVTGSFGYYNFPEIAAGQTVIISVAAKRFTFSASSIVLSLNDNASEINFTADAF